MKKYLLVSIGLFAVFILSSATPATVSAQSNALAYTPRTEAEKVAYLYGRISQLLEIQAQLRNGGSISALGNNPVAFNSVSVRTYRAVEVEVTSAVLRGEVKLFGDATASAWFEYGEDKNFLDLRSSRKNVRNVFDSAVRARVSNLEEEEVYYFRIVTLNKDKSVSYGEIFSFRTDEDEDND